MRDQGFRNTWAFPSELRDGIPGIFKVFHFDIVKLLCFFDDLFLDFEVQLPFFDFLLLIEIYIFQKEINFLFIFIIKLIFF